MRLRIFAYLKLTRHIDLGAKQSPKTRNQTVIPQTLAVRRIPGNDFFGLNLNYCLNARLKKEV